MTRALTEIQAELRRVADSIQAELVEVSETVAAFTAVQDAQTRVLRQLGTRVLRLHQEYAAHIGKIEEQIAVLKEENKNGGDA